MAGRPGRRLLDPVAYRCQARAHGDQLADRHVDRRDETGPRGDDLSRRFIGLYLHQTSTLCHLLTDGDEHVYNGGLDHFKAQLRHQNVGDQGSAPTWVASTIVRPYHQDARRIKPKLYLGLSERCYCMGPVISPSTEPASLKELHVLMAMIRAFELRVAELYRDGEIPGFVHTSLGQEAVAAGVSSALRRDDYLTTTHRGHGHVLAKGADLDGMMAELFARASGLGGGKGGSMHVADPSVGILGANAIVGAGIPLAAGAALSSKLLAQDRVAVSFFGEGAVNQGAFHEAVNLAAIWNLPVIFVCENNRYAEFTDSATMSRIGSVADRTRGGYGVTAVQVDGNNVAAVHATARDAAASCRAGDGPVLIEAITYRWHGHYEGDSQSYKPAEEAELWRTRDPLVLTEAELVTRGVATEEECSAVRAAAAERVEAAVAFARSAAVPVAEEAYTHVFVGPR